jgi:nucleoside-diphosphate-sugar epimerase
MRSMGERLAVVGGTGFISGAITTEALARGHDVRLFHRGTHPNETGAESVLVDRADTVRLAAELQRFAPTCVLDAYAMTAKHAQDLVSAMDGLAARLVVLSSQDVYAQFGRLNGLPAGAPEPRIRESSPLTIPFPFRALGDHPGGPDYDKKDVERVTSTRAATGVTVLRLPAVTGERDPKRRFGALVDALDRGERTVFHRGGATLRWSHTDVRDVARACVSSVERRELGVSIWNVGERDVPTMRQRANAIAAAIGVEIDWREADAAIEGPNSLFDVHANDVVVDDSAIRAALGWSERGSFEDLASELVASLRRSRAVS